MGTGAQISSAGYYLNELLLGDKEMAASGGYRGVRVILPGCGRDIHQFLALTQHSAVGIDGFVTPGAQIIQREINHFGNKLNI
jgi:hypothetical protein